MHETNEDIETDSLHLLHVVFMQQDAVSRRVVYVLNFWNFLSNNLIITLSVNTKRGNRFLCRLVHI